MSIEHDINSAFLYIKRIIDEYKNNILLLTVKTI